MDNSLLDNLKFLASQNRGFDNPYDDEVKSKKPDFDSIKTKKKRKSDSIDAFIADSEEYFERAAKDRDFDAIIDGIDYEDDDLELRDSLISMGRKYARDYAANADENEISKAFAPQEAQLKDLYTAISKEAMKLEEDISEMRQLRSRNFGKISDMVEVKTSLLSSQLQVIKEMNSMRKAQFDIRNKMKENNNVNGDSVAAESVIQSLFGLGHDTMLSSVGGRAGSSGAYMGNDNTVEDDTSFENSEAYGELMAGTDSDSDGAKFLKYEGTNVNLILTDYEDGHKEITAEDEDGNVIDDYPIPSNVDELKFEINNKTNIAVDQLQRKYLYRLG